VFEDVAVVHVAAAVGGEADGDFCDLAGVDADGVLEAVFVVVDDVGEFVAGVASERDGGGDGKVFDAVFGDLVADRAAGEDLEWVTSSRPRTGKNVVASSKWAAAAR
jgi:hypothetical protein